VIDSQKLTESHEIATGCEVLESGSPHLTTGPIDGGLFAVPADALAATAAT